MDIYRYYRKRKRIILARYRISPERKPRKAFFESEGGQREYPPSDKQSSRPYKRTRNDKDGNILTDAPALLYF